ncbi:ABC transporter substrate-binding protein [Parasedimentitalea psychrophila]|uniref:ABC transporter substrate-binding protein n=1 Tax=Parasedimentitalea psychrophila TaxID=2997337 RepID=A0A9Y2L0P4_9RHOB|nr:ABC transporter substrate-binding protein [Parasedimentitalea psychrophila]WIY25825.1 ABC transporter substrate-binding protein [Parasedimentitalea psychrophila]
MKTSGLVLAAVSAMALNVGGASAETFRLGSSGDLYGMDPHSMTDSFTVAFLHHVYEPLVRYDASLGTEPALATEWEWVSETTARYHLREGVTFHDGQEFTAEDVVASINRAIHPDSPVRGNMAGVIGAVAVDDFTVDITLEGPSPLLNNYLTNIYIMDRGWLEEHDSLDPIDAQKGEEGYTTSNANGTGPFILKSRTPDAKTVLTVNEGWWDEPVHNLTQIELNPINSDATRVAALLSGELDMIFPSPLQDARRIAGTDGIKVMQAPGLRTIMMGFNLSDTLNNSDADGNPLKDLRVRQAIAESISYDLLHEKIMRGTSRSAGTLVAPDVSGFDAEVDAISAYDPEAAKAKLAEAGYADGFRLAMNCPNDRYVNDAEICQALSAMMARVGIEVALTTETKSLHFQRARAGETDMFMLGWATLPMLDGFSVLSAMLHTPEGQYGTWNPGGYSNPEVDRLTTAVAVELDADKRVEMTIAALKIADDELAWLPLHQQPLSWAARDVVEIPQTADDKPRLWLAQIAN